MKKWKTIKDGKRVKIRSLKQLSEYLSVGILKNLLQEKLLQIIIKASVTDFYFQHIFDTFNRISLKYENYSLSRILF